MRPAFLIFLCVSCSPVCQTSSVVQNIFTKVAPGIASFVKECCEVAPLLAKARLRRSEYYGLKELRSPRKYESYSEPRSSIYDPLDLFKDEPYRDQELKPSAYDPRDRYTPYRNEMYHDQTPRRPAYDPRDRYSPYRDEPYLIPGPKTTVGDPRDCNQPLTYELLPKIEPRPSDLHSCDRFTTDALLHYLLLQLVKNQKCQCGDRGREWIFDILQQVKKDQSDCGPENWSLSDRSRVQDSRDSGRGLEPDSKQYHLLRQLIDSVRKQTRKDDQNSPLNDSEDYDILCEEEWIKRFWYIVRGQIRKKWMDEPPQEKPACDVLNNQCYQPNHEVVPCIDRKVDPCHDEISKYYSKSNEFGSKEEDQFFDDQPNCDQAKGVVCHCRGYQEGKGAVLVCHEEDKNPVINQLDQIERDGPDSPNSDRAQTKPWEFLSNQDPDKVFGHSEGYQKGKGEVIEFNNEGTGPVFNYRDQSSSNEYDQPYFNRGQTRQWDDQSNSEPGKIVGNDKGYQEGKGEVIVFNEEDVDPVSNYRDQLGYREYDRLNFKPSQTKLWDDQTNHEQGKVLENDRGYQKDKGEVIVFNEGDVDPVSNYRDQLGYRDYDRPNFRPSQTKPWDDQPSLDQGNVLGHDEGYQEDKGKVIVFNEDDAGPVSNYRDQLRSRDNDRPNIKPCDDPPNHNQGKVLGYDKGYQEGKGEVIVFSEDDAGPVSNYRDQLRSRNYDRPNFRPSQAKPWDAQPNHDQGKVLGHDKGYQEGKGEVIIFNEDDAGPVSNYRDQLRSRDNDRPNIKPWDDPPNHDQGKVLGHDKGYQEGKGEVIVFSEDDAGPVFNYRDQLRSRNYDRPNFRPSQAKPWDAQPNHDQGKVLGHDKGYQEGKGEVIIFNEDDAGPVSNYRDQLRYRDNDRPNIKPWDDPPNHDQGNVLGYDKGYQEGKGEVIVFNEDNAGPVSSFRDQLNPRDFDRPNFKPGQPKPWELQSNQDSDKVFGHSEGYQKGKGQVIDFNEKDAGSTSNYRDELSSREYDQPNLKPGHTKSWDDQPNYDQGKALGHSEGYQEGKGEVIVFRDGDAGPVSNYRDERSYHEYDRPNFKPGQTKSWDDQPNHDECKVICHVEGCEGGNGEVIVCHERGTGDSVDECDQTAWLEPDSNQNDEPIRSEHCLRNPEERQSNVNQCSDNQNEEQCCNECNRPSCNDCCVCKCNLLCCKHSEKCDLPGCSQSNCNECHQPECNQCTCLNCCNQCNQEPFIHGGGYSQCHSSGPGPWRLDSIHTCVNAPGLPQFYDEEWSPTPPCASDSLADLIVSHRIPPRRKCYDIRTTVRERY